MPSWHGVRARLINSRVRQVCMRQKNLLEEFQKEWEAFLRERKHKVVLPKGVRCVLQSKNAGGRRYRWLLFTARGKSKTLNRFELEDMKHHWNRARSLNETAYAVVSFQKPECKVIVIPADRVLKRKRILPTRGGIPWSD